MKTDFYTKTVLTIIAVALVALVIQNASIIPKAEANNLPLNRTTKGYDTVNVNIIGISGQPIPCDYVGNQNIQVPYFLTRSYNKKGDK